MKVGIITEGQAEVLALKNIVEKISIEGVQILTPQYVGMHPRATPDTIVRSAQSGLKILSAKNVDSVIVLLDLDSPTDCAATSADDLANCFKKHGYGNVSVVVKNQCFENWLISDPTGLNKMKARFEVTPGFIKLVSPNKADHVGDAEKLINSICTGKRKYHKSKDAINISKHIDPERMSENSRSFRRFLGLAGHPRFKKQSKRA